ncbi:MAG: hypothetical protein WBF77_04090 [Sulfurimonadaceae bacterium]
MLQCDLGNMAKPPACCTDLIERNTADLAGEPYDAVDLVFDPGHALFIGTHIRGKDVLLNLSEALGKAAQQKFFLLFRHFRVAVDNDFSTAVRKACCGIFQGHGPCEPYTFTCRDIGCDADTSDGGTGGNVVDHQYRF